MSVSNELYLNLKANKEDSISFILKFIKEGNFLSITINKKFISLLNFSDENLIQQLNDFDFTDVITVSVTGPYGHFELFEGLNSILTKSCKEAVNVQFDGVLNSTYETDGSERIIEFSYKKKTLKYADSNYFHTHSEDMYLKYISKKLSYKRFTSLFKLDQDEFDEDIYEEIILNEILEGSFIEMEYDEFIELLPDSKLKEEKFYDVMEKIEELELLPYEEFIMYVEGFEPKRKDWIKTTVKL